MNSAVSGLVEHTTTMASSDPATKIMALRREPILRSIQPASRPAKEAAILLSSPCMISASALQRSTPAAYTPVKAISTTKPSL